jgi:hypothetical protein
MVACLSAGAGTVSQGDGLLEDWFGIFLEKV